MEHRFLGSSGLKISALSYGAWVTFGDQIDEDTAAACMEAAYEAGVNFFDNAEAYAGGRAETMMGNILKKMGWRRSEGTEITPRGVSIPSITSWDCTFPR